jgi:hypothetical protein
MQPRVIEGMRESTADHRTEDNVSGGDWQVTPLSSSSLKGVVVAINSCEGSAPSRTFGLQTRHCRWSSDLPYAAAQALHYSTSVLHRRGPEKFRP